MKTTLLLFVITGTILLGQEPRELAQVRDTYEQKQRELKNKYVSWLEAQMFKASKEEKEFYQKELNKIQGKIEKKSVYESLKDTKWSWYASETIYFKSKNRIEWNVGSDMDWDVVDEDKRIIEIEQETAGVSARIQFNKDYTRGQVVNDRGGRRIIRKLEIDLETFE